MLHHRPLAIPLTGIQRVTLNDAGKPAQSDEKTFAAWQSAVDKVPQRVVVRLDGQVLSRDIEQPEVGFANTGFPCAVHQVRYAIGGYQRTVLVDAINQSTLTVFAESLDVSAYWDRRRIARLYPGEVDVAGAQLPFPSQQLAAAVSSVYDSGDANARWLDAIARDVDIAGEPPVDFYSLHPIPEGARAVRILEPDPDAPLFDVDFLAANSRGFETGVGTVIEAIPTGSIITMGVINPCFAIPAGCDLLRLHASIAAFAAITKTIWVEFIIEPAAGFYGY